MSTMKVHTATSTVLIDPVTLTRSDGVSVRILKPEAMDAAEMAAFGVVDANVAAAPAGTIVTGYAASRVADVWTVTPLTTPAPAQKLRRAQFKSFLRMASMTTLYDQAVAALAASPNLIDKYAADVATDGDEFDFPTTLTFAQAAAAQQNVTLDAQALRAVWDAAAALELGG